MKYKKFVDDGDGNCVNCFDRVYDCRCIEMSAKSLGYEYVGEGAWRRGNTYFASGEDMVDFHNTFPE